MSQKDQPSIPQTGNEGVGKPSDSRFADTKTDADPRTSDTGMTSVGGYDINADSLPDETPSVRREGNENVEPTATSENKNLSGDIMNPDL